MGVAEGVPEGDAEGVAEGDAEGDGERAADGEATESVAAGDASLDGVTILGFLDSARRRFECNCVSSVVRSFIGDNCVASSCGNKFNESDDVDDVGEKEMEVAVVVVLSATFINFFCLFDPGVLVFFLVDFLRGGFSRLFNFDSKRDTKSIPLYCCVLFILAGVAVRSVQQLFYGSVDEEINEKNRTSN